MTDPHDRTQTFALANSLQPVREVAEQIVAGDAFTDTDAVRVAEAYLEGFGEVNPSGGRE